MSIEGKWYMNPGDSPADFVYPVVLHADGRAEWLGSGWGIQPYCVVRSNLVIGRTGMYQMVFEIVANDSDWLGGVIRQPYEPDEDEFEDLPEEDRAGPHYFSDCAVLLREPGDLRVIEGDEAPAEVAHEDELMLLQAERTPNLADLRDARFSL